MTNSLVDKKEYKEYGHKLKLTTNVFKKQKRKIIDKAILNDEKIKKIMEDFDDY